MTADLRNGVLLLQNPYQSPQGILLPLGTSVGGLSPTVQTALVSNADAVFIEPSGVGTDPVQGSGAADVSILADVEMITYHRHSPFPMATDEVFLGEIGIDTGGGAVDDERSYPTQAVTPSAPAIAEATAMMIFRMICHESFFISFELFHHRFGNLWCIKHYAVRSSPPSSCPPSSVSSSSSSVFSLAKVSEVRRPAKATPGRKLMWALLMSEEL